MIFYFAVALILWLFTLLDIQNGILRPLLRVCAFFLLVGVAGLRFDTGYDWMVYEQVFFAIDNGENIASIINAFHMEPAFIGLCQIIGYLGGGLQCLFFIVAVFNIYAISKYLSLTKGAFLLGVSIYFCWIYLPVQMGVIRQSIGCSLVFLSIYLFNVKENTKAFFLLVLACAFQISILMFLLLFIPVISNLFKRLECFIILLSILAMIFKFDVSLFLLSTIAKVGFGFISEKVVGYSAGLQKNVSLTAQLYFVFNLLMYVIFRLNIAFRHKVSVFEFNIMLLLLLLEGLLWAFPLAWNRVQYVAILIQARIVYIYVADLYYINQFASVVTSSVISLIVLFITLNNPYSLPYFPYKNYLQYFIYGDDGSGRIRAENYYVDFEKMTNEKYINK